MSLGGDTGPNIKLATVHKRLRHCGEDFTRKTIKYYNWNTVGSYLVCNSCGIAKAKQASVSKELNEKSSICGEKFFLDTSSIKAESFGGNKFWIGMLDNCTDLFITKFLIGKKQVGEKVIEVLQELKVRHNISTKFIHCDDAPEHHKAEELCIKHGFNIQFEYTALGTP